MKEEKDTAEKKFLQRHLEERSADEPADLLQAWLAEVFQKRSAV